MMQSSIAAFLSVIEVVAPKAYHIPSSAFCSLKSIKKHRNMLAAM